MRRIISIMCAAALVMLAACQKEESTASKVALTATLEQQVDNGATKTALSLANNVIWSVGDQIKVNTTDGLETLTLTSGQGTAMGSFGSTTGDNPDYAIYPASACTSLSGSTFTFTLPATQTYAENSFGPGANVAVAAISGSNMAFKNVCGVLKLQLKGSMKVKKIELTGKDDEKLCGAFTVNAAASPFIGAVKFGEPTDDEKKVTLDCSAFGETSEGAADGGVQLDFETATIFDIVVPVSAFAGGFEAKITDVVGETFYTTLETSEDNTIARSTVTRMPRKAVSLLPEEYKELEFLASDGTQYLKTGVTTSEALELNATIEPTELFSYPMFTCVCAARVSQDLSAFSQGFYKEGVYFSFGYNGQFLYSKKNPVGKMHLKQNKTAVWINNEKLNYPKGYSTEITTPLELIAFGRNGNGSIGNLWHGRIYKLRLRENGTVVRFYVPAKVTHESGVTDVKGGNAPQGTVGMYDVVNSEFYTNDGTGSFVAGTELAD